MSVYVWCKNEECRVPSIRCLLCREDCYAMRQSRGDTDELLEKLIKSGKIKEHFFMKRKSIARNEEELDRPEPTTPEPESAAGGDQAGNGIFLMEDGQLRPFSPEEYTTATLYEVVESFTVECKLVRPDDPGNVVYEGKRPSRKTVPIFIKKNGDCVLVASWEAVEANPEHLADVREVLGAIPVRQAFVLKRK
jgi:hypothetical protein